MRIWWKNSWRKYKLSYLSGTMPSYLQMTANITDIKQSNNWLRESLFTEISVIKYKDDDWVSSPFKSMTWLVTLAMSNNRVQCHVTVEICSYIVQSEEYELQVLFHNCLKREKEIRKVIIFLVLPVLSFLLIYPFKLIPLVIWFCSCITNYNCI